MKPTAQLAALLLSAAGALAAPASSTPASPLLVAARETLESCDSYYQWDKSPYTIYHNNWGASSGSGSQCTTVTSVSGTKAAWETSWTWSGGSSSVKSYSNVALTSVNKQLKAVSSIPSTWKWSYAGSNLVADVSYDLWLAPTSGGTNSYEIMVWLAALGGAGPISSTGSAVATPSIADATWKLYTGPNGDTTVYSFVADSQIEDFSGDMMDFLNYLVDNEGVSDSLYITSLQAGTEPFTGTDAVFSTSAYTMTVS